MYNWFTAVIQVSSVKQVCICFSSVKHVFIADFPQSWTYVYLLLSVIQVCKPVSSCSHTGMYTCCSSFIQVCIHALTESYKHIHLLFLESYKYVNILLLSHSSIMPTLPWVIHYVYLLFHSMYSCSSWNLPIFITALPESHKYVYVLLLSHTSMYACTNIYTCSSGVVQICRFLKSYHLEAKNAPKYFKCGVHKGSLTVWALYAYFSDPQNAVSELLVWCM